MLPYHREKLKEIQSDFAEEDGKEEDIIGSQVGGGGVDGTDNPSTVNHRWSVQAVPNVVASTIIPDFQARDSKFALDPVALALHEHFSPSFSPGDKYAPITEHVADNNEASDQNDAAASAFDNGINKHKHYDEASVGNPTIAAAATKNWVFTTSASSAASPALNLKGCRRDEKWEQRYHDLAEFVEQHGHINMPAKYAPNQPLASWVRTQRTTHKKGTLSEERVNRLKKLGFKFDRAPVKAKHA